MRIVIVPNIFYARDDKSELEKITSGHLAEEIKKTGREAVYLPEFEDVLDYLHKNGGPDTVALTIGAGNVNEIARRFLNRDIMADLKKEIFHECF
jgi:UDP-N-acetylmuramate--alanine ligase